MPTHPHQSPPLPQHLSGLHPPRALSCGPAAPSLALQPSGPISLEQISLHLHGSGGLTSKTELTGWPAGNQQGSWEGGAISLGTPKS